MIIKKDNSLKGKAYEEIRRAILHKEILRNVIYSGQWFADEFQISRTPVREALLQLKDEGLIEVLPNRGFVVKTLTEQEAWDICQARLAIEGYCAMFMSRNVDDPKCQQSIEDVRKAMEHCRIEFNYLEDYQFHLDIISYTGNQELLEQFNRMRAKIDIFWSEIQSSETRAEEIYQEHKEILESIISGDEYRTYKAFEKHLKIVYEKIVASNIFRNDGNLVHIEELGRSK